MEKKEFNWLTARLESGMIVRVRQSNKYSCLFEDEHGNIYGITTLDFTMVQEESDEVLERLKENIAKSNEASERQMAQYEQMMQSFDATKIADHKAKIDEREYWRKLRGDIFLAIHAAYSGKMHAVELADQIVSALYKQDKEFFKYKH